MAKTKSHKRGRVWTASDHAERTAKRRVNSKQEKRSAQLAHDTPEQRDAKRLELSVTQLERRVQQLRNRLEQWDDVAEAARAEEEAKQSEEQEESQLKKKKQRKGPETWQLRGAARPAWEVYDFDVRYVDPHAKAQQEAQERTQRSRNLLVLGKGQFGTAELPEACREFLATLMQLGMLYQQANKMKSARKVFLECLDLERQEQPLTLARCHLMRLYLNAERPESAQRLWQRLPATDPSVWIRYSEPLVKFTLSDTSADEALVRAIRANLYCALYLAFGAIFDSCLEYVQEIQDATDEEALEEAIEYCNSEQRTVWETADGAKEWIQTMVLNGLKQTDQSVLSKEDVDWRGKLKNLLAAAQAGQRQIDDKSDVDDDDEVDVLMFAGMFQTAMEMVEEQYGLTDSFSDKKELTKPS
jgi:hypothetical protein